MDNFFGLKQASGKTIVPLDKIVLCFESNKVI